MMNSSAPSRSTRRPAPPVPHRSREEELDIQLAGHLAALLAVTDEIRAIGPSADLDAAAERLAEQAGAAAEEWRRSARRRAPPCAKPHVAALHQRAHALAGLLLSPRRRVPRGHRGRRSWPPSAWTPTPRPPNPANSPAR